MENKSKVTFKADFRTPLDFFNNINQEYGPFDLDAAASHENAKCDKYYTVEDNSIQQPWEGNVWINPPYKSRSPQGYTLTKWVEKAFQEIENENANIVVMLLPIATSTRYFHDIILPNASELVFIAGRLKFYGPNTAGHQARFDNYLVVFRNDDSKELIIRECDKKGKFINE